MILDDFFKHIGGYAMSSSRSLDQLGPCEAMAKAIAEQGKAGTAFIIIQNIAGVALGVLALTGQVNQVVLGGTLLGMGVVGTIITAVHKKECSCSAIAGVALTAILTGLTMSGHIPLKVAAGFTIAGGGFGALLYSCVIARAGGCPKFPDEEGIRA